MKPNEIKINSAKLFDLENQSSTLSWEDRVLQPKPSPRPKFSDLKSFVESIKNKTISPKEIVQKLCYYRSEGLKSPCRSTSSHFSKIYKVYEENGNLKHLSEDVFNSIIAELDSMSETNICNNMEEAKSSSRSKGRSTKMFIDYISDTCGYKKLKADELKKYSGVDWVILDAPSDKQLGKVAIDIGIKISKSNSNRSGVKNPDILMKRLFNGKHEYVIGELKDFSDIGGKTTETKDSVDASTANTLVEHDTYRYHNVAIYSGIIWLMGRTRDSILKTKSHIVHPKLFVDFLKTLDC